MTGSSSSQHHLKFSSQLQLGLPTYYERGVLFVFITALLLLLRRVRVLEHRVTVTIHKYIIHVHDSNHVLTRLCHFWLFLDSMGPAIWRTSGPGRRKKTPDGNIKNVEVSQPWKWNFPINHPGCTSPGTRYSRPYGSYHPVGRVQISRNVISYIVKGDSGLLGVQLNQFPIFTIDDLENQLFRMSSPDWVTRDMISIIVENSRNQKRLNSHLECNFFPV